MALNIAVREDGRLAQNILHFARALRAAGLPEAAVYRPCIEQNTAVVNSHHRNALVLLKQLCSKFQFLGRKAFPGDNFLCLQVSCYNDATEMAFSQRVTCSPFLKM